MRNFSIFQRPFRAFDSVIIICCVLFLISCNGAITAKKQANITYTMSISLAAALSFGGISFYCLKENRKINARLAKQNAEMIKLQGQVVELGKKAQEANHAKLNFFANISHEFTTPLTLITAPLDELMADPTLHATDKQQLGLIRKNVVRLLRLVNRLIDLGKIGSDKMTLQASENDLVSFANEIIGPFKYLAKRKGIELKLFTKEQQMMVWFDTAMLDKVLFHLLSNAFKFTNNNGHIHITLEKNVVDNVVKIRVEDDGIGMTKEMVQHAFELFYQGHITKQQGSGLGLAFSKELIDLHHGKITVTSQPENGTCFEIDLHLGTAHLEKDEMAAHKQDNEIWYHDERIFAIETRNGTDETEPYLNGHGNHEFSILIIEDDADLKKILSNKLSNEYEIMVADDGVKALQIAFDNAPDLVITDVVLPGTDGILITNILKNDIRTSHIPVVLLTAENAIDEKTRDMNSMADAYIAKPFNVVFLQETIKSLIKSRAVLRTHYTNEFSIGEKTQNPKKLDRKFINEFTSIIEKNIGNEYFSIDDLAQTIGISHVQLHRKVKALLGYDINGYLLSLRLQKAKHYLVETALSISEIAYKVGFSSPGNFSTVFKSKCGMTPMEFREK